MDHTADYTSDQDNQARGWFRMYNGVVDHIPTVGPLAMTVLVVIASHQNKNWVSWPGVARIAKEAETTDRSVRRCLKLKFLPSSEPWYTCNCTESGLFSYLEA